MKINPDSRIIAAWRYWRSAPREPMARWSGTFGVLFLLVPTTTLIGGIRALLGLNGTSLIDRAEAIPFLGVSIAAGYLEWLYLRRPLRPPPY